MRQKRRLRDHAGLFERAPYYRQTPRWERRKIAKRLSNASTTGDTFPALTCGVAYGSGPTTDLTTATFTNEAARLKNGSTSRGRSNELDAITTSTAQLLFLNADRNFDPSYNFNIVPLLPVRVSATFNNTVVPIFTGYATGFPQHYSAPNYAESPVSCVDALEIIRNVKTLGTPWETQAAIVPPTHWYRLSDTTAQAADIGTRPKGGVYAGSFIQGANSLVLTSTADTALTLADGYVDPGNVTVSTPAISFGVWFTGNTAGAAKRVLLSVGTYNGASDYLLVYQNTAGKLVCEWQSAPSGGTLTSLGTVHGGGTHYLSVTLDWLSAGLITLYVDGVAQATGSGGANFDTTYVASPTSALKLGAFTVQPLSSTPTFTGWAGTVDELMVWTSTALTGTQVADLYNAGNNGWTGDTTGKRIGRYLDAAGWPAAMRDIDDGYTTLIGAGDTSDAMAGIQDAVKAEAGLLYVSPMGKVVFRNRYRRITDNNSLAPLATFGDGNGSEYPYLHDGFALQYDRDRIRTSATANRPGAAVVATGDATNRVGVRTESLGELLLATDTLVRARVEYVVDRYRFPVERLDSIAIRPKPPEANDTWAYAMLWSIILNADLSQQLQVIRRPQSVGSAITMAVLIERVEHAFAPFDWRTTLALSPADTKPKFRWNLSAWDTTTDGWAY